MVGPTTSPFELESLGLQPVPSTGELICVIGTMVSDLFCQEKTVDVAFAPVAEDAEKFGFRPEIVDSVRCVDDNVSSNEPHKS